MKERVTGGTSVPPRAPQSEKTGDIAEKRNGFGKDEEGNWLNDGRSGKPSHHNKQGRWLETMNATGTFAAELSTMEIPFSFSQYAYPLNPSATLSFTLEEQQEISLRIYNTYGQVVHMLYDRELMKPGYHELRLYGETFPSGGCYARLQTKYGVQQRTLVSSSGTPVAR